MAGMAATASIARSAASIINFFNSPTSLSSRGTVLSQAGRSAERPASYQRAIAPLLPRPLLAGSRGGLVDLLVARRRVRRANRDRGADLLELKVVGLRGVLDEV